jgi:hypothetical protein
MDRADNILLFMNLRRYKPNELEDDIRPQAVSVSGQIKSIIDSYSNNNKPLSLILRNFYKGNTADDIRTNIKIARHLNLSEDLKKNKTIQLTNLTQLITILSLFDKDMNYIQTDKYKDFIKMNVRLLHLFNEKDKRDELEFDADCSKNEEVKKCDEKIAEISGGGKPIKAISGGGSMKTDDREHIIINDGINKRYALLNNKKYQIINESETELLITTGDNEFKRIKK